MPENPASYRVVRTKSYLFNKAAGLVNFCRGTWLYLPDQCQYGVRLTLTRTVVMARSE
ncbi:hypothetical protein B6H32_004802 [Salmonella enterica subsp. enterica serovar Cubana]|nr:hypothetical protein [Salmonella enterica subsp. enterica serovar Cubana]